MTKPFYDVFVSHAYEDQNAFASTLALALKKKGLKVWYSGFELTPEISITSVVDEALHESKYGVIVISPVYLARQWAMKQLEELFAQENNQERILPVLHKITIHKFRQRLPVLADRHAVSSRIGVTNVVNRVLLLVTGKKVRQSAKTKTTTKKKRTRKATAIDIQHTGVIVLGGKAGIENTTGGSTTVRNAKK